MEIRVDKWLWAVRVFKTRTVATDACKKGRVKISVVAVTKKKKVNPG
ncbi:MAG: RNA-binding S4 domain-containing protein, partial [Duncaniella sp.]|nr:RNA-binding S4 domain-containing protein [Duncaniella sp.]